MLDLQCELLHVHSSPGASVPLFANWREVCWSLVPWTIETPAPSLPHLLLASPQLSGKWFYIASASRNAGYKHSAKTYQAAFFYFDPSHKEDTIQLRAYSTIGNQCVYKSALLNVHRKEGTLSIHENGREQFAYVWLTKDPRTFMFAYFLDDKQNMGLSFYADRPEVTPEQMSEFHEAIGCIDIDKSEIMYTDEKKDQCGLLEKQHEEERKEKQEEA
uniref:Lipocalin/cytosolic fatty-acid binding domain-containing protein n=1 Tax=Equus asinus TaxID=9793 RepID=A0A9L0IH09_EQUAS